MNVLIAIDSFKDCLSSIKAGESVRRGILAESDNYQVKVLPVADGGEGTDEALLYALGGKWIKCKVNGPLMKEMNASYVILDDGKTAVIEMAKASGLELLSSAERNPWITTTFGTGQLMKDALDRGCRRMIIAIGGSATNDAGAGMAQALGVRLTNKAGKNIPVGGGGLSELENVDITKMDDRLSVTDIIVACDVSNPLTGPDGASVVYGPQKGADAEMVKKLDQSLEHFARKVEDQLSVHFRDIPGAGAAGGLGGGLFAFAGAGLKPGFEILQQETGLEKYIEWADLVITGEGKMDTQTSFGKTPAGVANLAKRYNKPVIGLAGTLGEGYQELYVKGFDAVFSVIDKPMSLNEAIITAPQLLERSGRSVIRLWMAGRNYKRS